ncbi:MAG: glycoside hydrolase family 5 protein [Oscillospiraceae bacterium]|nr:glycoside hydrolase family 5 protein [Oscillospiraceae bacterium]
MKKFFAVFITLIIALSLVSCGSAKGTDEYTCETAEEAVANIALGFNFGNTLDTTGDWFDRENIEACETGWGNPLITKEQVAAVKKAGFNAVRLPVTWRDHIDEDGTIDKIWLDRVAEIVDYIMDEDLYCIVNVHHDTGSDGWIRASEKNYNEKGDVYAKIWEQVATRFKDHGEKLLFESINETLDEQGNWGWPDAGDTQGIYLYTQRFVDVVRSCGGYNEVRNLVLNTYAASSGGAISDFILPEDTVENHLILEVHNYDPQGFCWQDASWTQMTDEWGSDSDKAAMDSYFEDTARRANELGLPLIIGEFGSWDKGNDSERAEHAGYVVGKANEYGIKCFWWSCGDAQLIDRYTAKPVHEEIIEAMVKAIK